MEMYVIQVNVVEQHDHSLISIRFSCPIAYRRTKVKISLQRRQLQQIISWKKE